MNKMYQHQSDLHLKHFVYPEYIMYIQVLVKVDPGTVSNEKQKQKNQPSTGFYPGTVLQNANPGLSLRVLAGKSNLQVLVLPRKGN